MSRALGVVVLALAAAGACGGDPVPAGRGRSTTPAAEPLPKAGTGEAARRARAEHTTDDDTPTGEGKKWGGWRYQGSRDDCFYVVARKCYASREDACDAARCGKKDCKVDGGGPATIRCE